MKGNGMELSRTEDAGRPASMRTGWPGVEVGRKDMERGKGP